MKNTHDKWIESGPHDTVIVRKAPRGFTISVTARGSKYANTVLRPYSSEYPRYTRLTDQWDGGLTVGEAIARQYGVAGFIATKFIPKRGGSDSG